MGLYWRFIAIFIGWLRQKTKMKKHLYLSLFIYLISTSFAQNSYNDLPLAEKIRIKENNLALSTAQILSVSRLVRNRIVIVLSLFVKTSIPPLLPIAA